MKQIMRSAGLSAFGLATSLTVQAAELLLEFTFNDSGPITQVSERSSWDWPLTFQSQDGATADWHGAQGSGLSGKPGDRAFDNVASTQMGSGGLGGRAWGVPGDSPALDSVTFSGWFRTEGQPIGSFGRLWFWDGPRQVFGYPDASLYFAAGGNRSVGSDAAYPEVDEWVFFAVTFDGTQSADNVTFWKGTLTSAVSAVSTRSLPAGAFEPANYQFALGNSYHESSPTQPLDGQMDNFRLHGGTGSAGVLQQSELEALRTEDAAGTNPATRIRVELDSTLDPGPPPTMTFGWWSIAGYLYQLQRSSDLEAWTDVAGLNTTGDGTRQERTLTPLPTTPEFYRLKVVTSN